MHTDALDRLETACTTAVARDLAQAGVNAVYVIDADACGLHPQYHGAIDASYAYTLKAHIREWRGPGPAFIARTNHLPAVLDRFDLAGLAAVCAHELGHALDERMLSPVCPVDVPVATEAALQGANSFDPLRFETDWIYHGPRFARAALHSAYRLVTLADHPCGINALWPKSQCEVNCWDAFRALEAEMQSRLAEPISAILATTAPDAFTKLFTRWKS